MNYMSILLIFTISLASACARAGWFTTAEQEARALFAQGDYSSAASRFNDAYRQGVAWYRAGQYEQAAQAFSQSANPATRADALYNLGNSRFQQQRYAEAASAYEQALRIAPEHEDAAYNLRLTKAKLTPPLVEQPALPPPSAQPEASPVSTPDPQQPAEKQPDTTQAQQPRLAAKKQPPEPSAPSQKPEQNQQKKQEQSGQQQAEQKKEEQSGQQQAEQKKEEQSGQQQAEPKQQEQSGQQQAEPKQQEQSGQQQAEQKQQEQSGQQQGEPKQQEQSGQQQAQSGQENAGQGQSSPQPGQASGQQGQSGESPGGDSAAPPSTADASGEDRQTSEQAPAPGNAPRDAAQSSTTPHDATQSGNATAPPDTATASGDGQKPLPSQETQSHAELPPGAEKSIDAMAGMAGMEQAARDAPGHDKDQDKKGGAEPQPGQEGGAPKADAPTAVTPPAAPESPVGMGAQPGQPPPTNLPKPQEPGVGQAQSATLRQPLSLPGDVLSLPKDGLPPPTSPSAEGTGARREMPPAVDGVLSLPKGRQGAPSPTSAGTPLGDLTATPESQAVTEFDQLGTGNANQEGGTQAGGEQGQSVPEIPAWMADQWLRQVEGDPGKLLGNQLLLQERKAWQTQGNRLVETRPW